MELSIEVDNKVAIDITLPLPKEEPVLTEEKVVVVEEVVPEVAVSVVEEVVPVVDTVVDEVAEKVKDVIENLPGFEKVADLIDENKDKVKEVIEEHKDKVKDLIEDNKDKVIEKVEDAIEKMVSPEAIKVIRLVEDVVPDECAFSCLGWSVLFRKIQKTP